jgi:surface protein
MAETIYKIGNKILKIGGKLLTVYGDAPTPSLPPYTIRLKYQDGVTPTFYHGGTGVQVSSSPNIWDLTYENSDWLALLDSHTNLLEVMSANTTGVSSMRYMLRSCSALTSVSLLDTSSCTSMEYMFAGCSSIESVPLFNTSSVTNMAYMFYNCYKVESGALALYQQASTQSIVPSHNGTFRNCGRDTVTGAAELAQIPSSWGGTGA